MFRCKLRSLKDNCQGMIDLGVVLMVGIAFVGLMLVAYIIWTLKDQLITIDSPSALNNTTELITDGFDDAVGLILIAITIMVLAIALSALMMLRGR